MVVIFYHNIAISKRDRN